MSKIKEKTLILIKPDALQRGIAGQIIGRLEQKGLRLVGCKMIQMTDQLTDEHYSHLVGRDFYPGVKNFMQSTPVIALAVEGQEAVTVVRKLTGVTKGHQADIGTIRGDLCISGQTNLIHASDSLETAQIELARFFKEGELFDYPRAAIDFLYGPDERPEEA